MGAYAAERRSQWSRWTWAVLGSIFGSFCPYKHSPGMRDVFHTGLRYSSCAWSVRYRSHFARFWRAWLHSDVALLELLPNLTKVSVNRPAVTNVYIWSAVRGAINIPWADMKVNPLSVSETSVSVRERQLAGLCLHCVAFFCFKQQILITT